MSTSERKWATDKSEYVAECVGRALEEFASKPDVPTLLPGLAQEYPDAFFAAALKHLESDAPPEVQQLLGGLLARQESLPEKITDPAICSRESAVRVFKLLLTINPKLDFQLARMLPGRGDASPDKALSESHAARAIEILGETSSDQRLLSMIGPLVKSLNPRISSKAMLFAGRLRANDPRWLSAQLGSEDPRMRANLLESVWGVDSGVVLRLLENCTRDLNNRVAGNALIGLHLANDPHVATRVLEMSKSEDAGRRSSAAWVMGKIGNPVFTGRLTELLRDADAKVRSTAVRSLVRIRRVSGGQGTDSPTGEPPIGGRDATADPVAATAV